MVKDKLDENKVAEFEEFIEKHKDKKGAVMPILQEAQNKFGYLPEEIMELISKKLDIFLSEIYGVATFYSQFTFFPKGKYSISVCLGTACYVKGAKGILEEFMELLGIGVGETTPDRKFSIVETRCVGLCSDAPVVMINNKAYPHFDKNDVKKILEELE